MKKGQGVKPTTLFEAIHGSAASPEVEKHLAILKQYRKAVFVLAVKKQLMADSMARKSRKNWAGCEARHIEAQTQRVLRLKDDVIESWERVSKQPTTLLKLAQIAEQKGARYPEYKIVCEAYDAGERSQPVLFAIARRKNPNLTASDFSEVKKQLGLHDLKKGKPGRESKRPTHAEQVEALRIKWLEGVWTTKQFREKLDEIQEAHLARLEAQEKILA
jgi:hypothetical protein